MEPCRNMGQYKAQRRTKAVFESFLHELIAILEALARGRTGEQHYN